MAKREPPKPSPKLLGLLRDFQAIASMAGYLTHVMDAPQLRLMCTLYGRIAAASEEEARALEPGLRAWSDRIIRDLREDSSATILPPQVQYANPQPLPNGQWHLVATLTFTTKVTDAAYLRIRTAILRAYQRAVILREKGLETAMATLDGPVEDVGVPIPEATGEEPVLEPEASEVVEVPHEAEG